MMKLLRPIVERTPRLASMYRLMRDNWGALAEPPPTKLGFRFMGNGQMAAGEFEPVETSLVQKLLRHCEVVVNVGANVGYYTCQALHQGRKVVAFEPIATNYHILLKNVNANGWSSRAEVFPLALSDQPGIVEIFGGGTGASIIQGYSGISKRYSTLISSSTLDIVLSDRYSGSRMLAIVDVEGAEYRFLQGAQRFLAATPRPLLMMEIAIRENQPPGVPVNPRLFDTFEALWELGFRSYAATRELREIGRRELEAAIGSAKDPIGTRNFLFADRAADPVIESLRQ